MQMTDIMTVIIKSLTEDWPEKSQRMNRAVGNNKNHPEPEPWWIYLGYLLHVLAIVLILLLITYLCPYICVIFHKRNKHYMQGYRHWTH